MCDILSGTWERMIGIRRIASKKSERIAFPILAAPLSEAAKP
jgi:CO dehydrogenase/acetyl-CoA synthase gamma subunit (corrinoid Fe-S protein)